MKVAFQILGKDLWHGGMAWVRNFWYAVRSKYDDRLTLCLLAKPTSHIPDAVKEEVNEIVYVRALQTGTARWALDKAIKRTFARSIWEERSLMKNGIDVVFRSGIPYRYSRVPTLSWIPDFQHVHLPEMFSSQDRLQRDRVFLRTAKFSTRVILMSEAAKKDYQAFVPMYADKARVLYTASYVPESIYRLDPKLVMNLYHLPEKFVYLPNQFWRHKNHEIVFHTLKILKDRGIEILLVCSGHSGDYRYLTYFASLFRKLSEWGIRNQVAYLGLIPHTHLLLLMRQAVCVLNPSLFEGLGLTVDEARSIGKQVLLSDIPPHREQNPPKAVFFDPYDCEDLAQRLSEIWQKTPPGPDIELERRARETLPGRIRRCAESFVSVVREVVDEQANYSVEQSEKSGSLVCGLGESRVLREKAGSPTQVF